MLYSVYTLFLVAVKIKVEIILIEMKKPLVLNNTRGGRRLI